MPELPPFTRRAALGAAGALGAGLALGGLPPTRARALEPRPAPVKQKVTYYTEEMRANARANIAAGHDWAQTTLSDAEASAAGLLAQTDDWLWSAITAQGLGRSYQVHPRNLTPENTTLPGAYGWAGDPYGHPWKIQDPSTGTWFPTNDFGAYYRSGLDERGEFDRVLADRSLLVNTLYPEKGATWGVDDGWGWVDDEGERYMFVAYWNHWFVWGYNNSSAGGLAMVGSGLQALRDAYLYTGDPRYAHAGVILLDRIADVYPSLHTGDYLLADGFMASDGLTQRGKETGKIWATFTAKILVSAYDAFFPAINENDDAGVLDFLRTKAADHGLAPKETLADIRSNIENNILRVIEPEARVGNIHGNFGMHQSAIAAAAAVLDSPDETVPWMEFVMQRGGFVGYPSGPWSVTGGNVAATLVEDVDRDGWGYESPGYNNGWINQAKDIADTLANYTEYPDAVDLNAHPKFEAMMLSRHTLTIQNAFTPSIGDTAQVGKPMFLGTAQNYAEAFVRYRDREDLPQRKELAQVAHLCNDNTVAGINAGMFIDAGELQQQIQQFIDTDGPLNLASDLNPGYGASFFRNDVSGPAGLLYSGGQYAHGHRDALFVNMWHHGLDIASALGYPEYADSRPRTVEWFTTTIASNTVTVDATPQTHQLHNSSVPHLWVDTETVKSVDTDATAVYADRCSTYRRHLTQIKINDDDAYYVDVFDVVGGSDHVFSFHAVANTAEVEGVTLAQQVGGTYAGADIPEPPDTTSGGNRANSGFNFLTNVSRGAPSAGFSVDWPILDPYDIHTPGQPIHLRLSMVDGVDEVALADGRAPANKPGNPTSLRYLLARRSGEQPHYIEESSPAVSYTGIWTNYEGAAPHGGAYRLSHWTTPDASVTITWTGGRAQVLGSSVHSGQVHGLARAELDGEDMGTISFSRPKQVYQEVMYDTGEIPDGDHTLTITALGEKGEYAGANDLGIRISFDALVLVAPTFRSRFVSVLQPYHTTPFIAAIERVEVTPLSGTVDDDDVTAIKIELTDGRVDYLVSSRRPEAQLRIDDAFTFRGRFGMFRMEGGTALLAVTSDATQLAPLRVSGRGLVRAMAGTETSVTGTVADFTRTLSNTSQLVIQLDGRLLEAEDLVGEHVYVANDGERNAVYRITGASAANSTLTLEVEGNTVRAFGPDDATYAYNLEVGQQARIPLTREWVAEG